MSTKIEGGIGETTARERGSQVWPCADQESKKVTGGSPLLKIQKSSLTVKRTTPNGTTISGVSRSIWTDQQLNTRTIPSSFPSKKASNK